MSNQFDRHAFDDALTHNAQLKVGGLETPCPVCAERDELRVMQLVAISTASNQNTESTVKDRIGFDHPYCSTAYQDVCRAVDREIALRKACADRDAEIARLLESQFTQCSLETMIVALREQNRSLRALLDGMPHLSAEHQWVITSSECSVNCPRCAYEKLKL